MDMEEEYDITSPISPIPASHVFMLKQTPQSPIISWVKEGLNQLQYDVNEILQSNGSKNFHFPAKLHSNFSMSDPSIIIQNLLQILIDIVDLKLIEDILDNKPFFISEVLKLASFLFHENFLCSYWQFTYKCAVNTESPKSLFYDRLKWIYYAHKQLTNGYYFISNSPKFKQIVLSSLSKVQTEAGNKEENSEDEIEEEEISVFSYEIFVYHCLNSFLVASKEFLALQQDVPSTSLLLPRQVVSWFSFFDDSLLRKFLTFFLFLQENSMNEAVNTRINQGFTQDDRSFLFQQFLLCIEDPSLLLRFLTISCQIFQHRKKKWTDEDMINSEESRVGGFLISVITRYLTVIRSVDTTENEEPEKYSKENYLMSQLIDRIFLKFDFSSSFIQRLFPPNPSHVSSIPSSAFVTVFSKHQLLMLLCKLIDSWGSPYFQNNAMLSRYQSLSVFILTILTSGAVIRSDLASPIFLVKGPQSAPSNESPMISVESLLVEAVSKGLESSLPLVRYYTMKIAQEYARLMEYSLEFDELKELENQNKIKQQPAKLKDEAENDSEEEEEENDEDEIQGYYISKEQDSIVNDLYLPPPTTSSDDGSLSKRKKIYYLRECLELLKAPEGSPDIRAGIILALDNLPTILQNHPYDGQNFAHPLLFQLLNLSDQYNIEEFDRLKSEAIISLVKEYPLQTLPLLNQSILNRDLPLALRIHSIQYHRIVATFFYEQNMKTIAEESMKSDTKIANFNNFDKQKTVIKRPRRYELLRKKYEQQRQEKQLGYSTVKKNVFQEYSELFISPVLQQLQQFHEHYSKGNTSTSMQSTLSLSSSEPKSFLANPIEVEKDRFNLIAEAFPEDKKPSNRSTLLNDESFELTTLKLPSSTSPMKKKSESVKPLIQEINNDIDMKVTSKVENKPSQGKKFLKSSSSVPPKLPDEMDILLPYDALLSLAIYMRYSTFQNQYSILAFVCVELSITYFKTFTMSLGLRRASLCLLMTVIEGLLNSYDAARSSGSSLEERLKIAGVLDSLLKITALHNVEEERHLTQTASSTSNGLNAIKEELLSRTSVLELIEILLERMEQQKESDQLCQQLTVSLIKIFQEQLFS